MFDEIRQQIFVQNDRFCNSHRKNRTNFSSTRSVYPEGDAILLATFSQCSMLNRQAKHVCMYHAMHTKSRLVLIVVETEIIDATSFTLISERNEALPTYET